ncbi:OLC1v1020663C1 [Oldenlandia corymbosa var. corymbosa]|uniref:OLC1v1020663C1 n=1 Tax=Oldenlandia corymbosa var. corymbosa TaxID=529605 RepID=A0AAV1EH35_OLDCO|nr:OLC1v1020663C1 [Oldenlandia corymbosa var. corymbosa]
MRPTSSSSSAATHWTLTLDRRFAPVGAAAVSRNPNPTPLSSSSSPPPPVVINCLPRGLTTAAMGGPASSNALSSAWHYGNGRNKNNSGVDVRRKQRIASYKAYAVESKLKNSVRSGFRWMKNKYTYIVHGY